MYSQIDSNKHKTYLLIAIFSSFIIFIGWIMNYYLGYSYNSVIFAVVIATVMPLISYFKGDKIALMSTGAKITSKAANSYVYRLVENLCITAGLPVPKVYIIDSPALNAFATGRDPNHASIALTTGIVQALENEELEGVIAHELSHIQNFDIRLMTIVTVLVGAIALISDWFFRMRVFGGKRKDSEGGGGIMAILSIIFLIISPIIAQLIHLAISRRREYLADASGSLLTRYPEGLARALEKISQSNEPLVTASSATAHLFISNPFKGKAFSSLFSTHPPIEDRINKLRGMIK